MSKNDDDTNVLRLEEQRSAKLFEQIREHWISNFIPMTTQKRSQIHD